MKSKRTKFFLLYRKDNFRKKQKRNKKNSIWENSGEKQSSYSSIAIRKSFWFHIAKSSWTDIWRNPKIILRLKQGKIVFILSRFILFHQVLMRLLFFCIIVSFILITPSKFFSRHSVSFLFNWGYLETIWKKVGMGPKITSSIYSLPQSRFILFK